jgi:serine/threonine-protein kinase
MEFAAGENLNDKVERRGPLASHRVINVLRRVCGALGEVHARKLVHGDIKPANIMTSEFAGPDGGVKLVDFGLARSVDGQNNGLTTPPSGTFAGSPLYASPESYAGIVDGRSDIYSLGAAAFFLLTGRPVFDESRPVAAILAHAGQSPVSVTQLRPGVPPALDAIVIKCLHKNPQDRFQTVEELDVALSEVDEPYDCSNRLESALSAPEGASCGRHSYRNSSGIVGRLEMTDSSSGVFDADSSCAAKCFQLA